MGIIEGLIIGGIAGYLAGKVMKSSNGMIVNIVLGIVGGGVGSFALHRLGLYSTGGLIGEIVSSTLGAIIIIFIGRKVFD